MSWRLVTSADAARPGPRAARLPAASVGGRRTRRRRTRAAQARCFCAVPPSVGRIPETSGGGHRPPRFLGWETEARRGTCRSKISWGPVG